MQASPSSPWSRASKQSHSHRPSTTRPHCPLRITNRLTSSRSWNRTYPHSVAQSHRVLSRRYTPPLHPASILDNPLAPEMQQLELCGHDSFWRRPACIRCGDRIIDVPQLVAEVSTSAATVSSSSSLKRRPPRDHSFQANTILRSLPNPSHLSARPLSPADSQSLFRSLGTHRRCDSVPHSPNNARGDDQYKGGYLE